jgi:hypothetical protein
MFTRLPCNPQWEATILKPMRAWLAMAALLSLAACTSYAPTPFWTIRETAFKGLTPGVTTKEDVRKQVGVPLSEMYFPRQEEDVWEYRYLEGTTVVMIAYVYFDSKGVYKHTFHMYVSRNRR